MKKFIALMLAAMMVVSMFAGCGSSEPEAPAADAPAADAPAATAGEAAAGDAAPAPIKIGLTGPLTGSASAYGLAVRAGMEIAVEEINADPNNKLKIEFKAEDDEADGADKAIGAYNALKDWGMQVMAGPVTTGSSLAIAAECVSDEIFMLTPSASAVEVATTGPNVYQMCFTDPNQGASAAELMAEKWPNATIGVIYDASDAYSAGIKDGFIEKAAELNLNVAVETSFMAETKSNLGSLVQKCKDANCDLVFLPFYYTEASQVLTSAANMSYAPTFFGCDGMDGILTVEGFDASLAEGLVLMTPFDANATDDATVSFVAKFKEKMDGLVPNQFAADGYDVIYTLYNACVAAGVDGSDSNADICAALMEQFAAGLTVDGLTGKGMTWDENGMISKAPAAMVITGGIYVPMA